MFYKEYENQKKIVLLSNGLFPSHPTPVNILNNSNFIICCDGAANKLENYGKKSNLIIGDLDSLDDNVKNKYHNKIIEIKEQNTNDLRKALHWISENLNIEKLLILGATGLREDHSFGNISTFLYDEFDFEIEIITDMGVFYIINSKKKIIGSFEGQNVSIFSINPNQKIKTTGLEYELNDMEIQNLYSATLNSATKKTITIESNLKKPFLVYCAY